MSSPWPIFAVSISGDLEMYSMIVAGSTLARNAVGPTIKKNRARTSASARLILDNQRTPRATPDTAEIIVPMDKTTMMPMASALPVGDHPETTVTPWEICMAPIPREAAVPKSVAIIARPSMMRPCHESVDFAPNSGMRMELISGTRPRR